MNSAADAWAAIGLFVLMIIIVLPLSVIIGAFVLQTLWGWFVVPLGVIPLTFWWAAGVDLLVSSFFLGEISQAVQDIRSKTADMKPFTVVLNTLLTRPVLILIFGLIIHNLMVR